MIEVVEYNPSWIKDFEAESLLIKNAIEQGCLAIYSKAQLKQDKAFENSCDYNVDELRTTTSCRECALLYHIGSTSIPKLKAKPIVDILCVVDSLEYTKNLEGVGYRFKGEYNIPMRWVFDKKTDEREVHLHCCLPNNGFVNLNLAFRDFLRDNPNYVKEYAQLKDRLLNDPSAHIKKNEKSFKGYTLGKNDFIKHILKLSGFNDLHINFCTHYTEKDEYSRLMKKGVLIEKTLKVEMNPTRFNQEYKLVLYKGVDIVACCLCSVANSNEVNFLIACNGEKDSEEYSRFITNFSETWLYSTK